MRGCARHGTCSATGCFSFAFRSPTSTAWRGRCCRWIGSTSFRCIGATTVRATAATSTQAAAKRIALRLGRATETIRTLLAREGLSRADGEVWLQTFPRVLGYVFNPVSFWLCHDRAGKLRAVLCEVNNTFGEHHNYLLAHPDERPIEPGDVLSAGKVFHVSPFCEVAGGYRFQFALDPAAIRVRIDYDDPAGKLLATSVSGRAQALTSARLAMAFVLYPWMTAAVIARIHWQALRLWVKGVRFVPKPEPPVQETTR